MRRVSGRLSFYRQWQLHVRDVCRRFLVLDRQTHVCELSPRHDFTERKFFTRGLCLQRRVHVYGRRELSQQYRTTL